MFANFDVETPRRASSDDYRSAKRSMLTMRAERMIDQTEELARELEFELDKFAKELKAGR
jgi:hypothetical protein